ncbi:MAG TPA: histidine kinase [Cyanobacteria bacterium UBA8803]|nr:histidine kinase [Cyanobacteria bacterium UBA9273]HBL57772.1 histidine kinase [Cyanobacteria bacterium UBA8803]
MFPHRRDVEAALYELRQAGFPMDRISVVGKNADRDDRIAGVEMKNSATGNKADEGAAAGAASGAALGGLGGLLVGLGALAIPGIGPVLAGGALATALATTAAGGAIGAAAGGLTGALVGLGIPEERARFYNDRVTHGDYLVMVDGDDDELRRAQAILSRHGIREWGVYDTSDIAPGQDRDRTPDADRYRREHGTPGSPHHTLVGYKRAVGVFPHRRDAEAAIRELHNAGFPMNQISLVGKDTPQESHVGSANVTDRTQVDEGAKAGAAGGAALGGLGGLLVGLGALAIPGIGPVLAGGALATALATTAAGGAIGAAAGGLTGALVGLGIPDNRARFYNDRVNRGDYLVMVDGTEDEIRRAEAILRRHSIQDWDIFDAPDRDRHDRDYVGTSSSRTVGTAVSHPSYADSTPNVTIIDRREQIL